MYICTFIYMYSDDMAAHHTNTHTNTHTNKHTHADERLLECQQHTLTRVKYAHTHTHACTRTHMHAH